MQSKIGQVAVKAEVFREYNLALTRDWLAAVFCAGSNRQIDGAQRPWSGMTCAATRRFQINKMTSAPMVAPMKPALAGAIEPNEIADDYASNAPARQ
jgi:hypothetical protein